MYNLTNEAKNTLNQLSYHSNFIYIYIDKKFQIFSVIKCNYPRNIIR